VVLIQELCRWTWENDRPTPKNDILLTLKDGEKIQFPLAFMGL
jgi:hypothetical protein